MTPHVRKAIVVVDDEKSYVDLLSELLAENLPNPVVTFTRPLEALAALPGFDVGMIVTDYYMPQFDGLEFINRARMIKPGVPFIIITGHGIHLANEEFSHLPELKAVLHKPFGWRSLADQIVQHWPDQQTPVIKTDVFLP